MNEFNLGDKESIACLFFFLIYFFPDLKLEYFLYNSFIHRRFLTLKALHIFWYFSYIFKQKKKISMKTPQNMACQGELGNNLETFLIRLLNKIVVLGYCGKKLLSYTILCYVLYYTVGIIAIK